MPFPSSNIPQHIWSQSTHEQEGQRKSNVTLVSLITLTSGAIQNGVPTDVFRRCQVLVSWADTPARERRDLLLTLIPLGQGLQLQ